MKNREMHISVIRESIIDLIMSSETTYTASELARAVLSDNSPESVRRVSNALTSHSWYERNGIERSKKGTAYGYGSKKWRSPCT